jgi:hypothetical protein
MGTQPQQALYQGSHEKHEGIRERRDKESMSLSHLLSFSRFFFCTSKLRLYVKQVCDRVFKKSTY